MSEEYIPGEGCECSARCSCECGCDVDWTPREVYELRDKAERYRLDANAMMMQRDNLVDALDLLLDGLLTYAPDYMHGLPKRHYVDEAMEALAAVKGGQP